MSTVYLQLGQCGNQLGQAFWEEASTSKWSGSYCKSSPAHVAGRKPAKSGQVVASSSGTLQPDTGRGSVVPPSLSLGTGRKTHPFSSSTSAALPQRTENKTPSSGSSTADIFLPQGIGTKTPSSSSGTANIALPQRTKRKTPSSNSSTVVALPQKTGKKTLSTAVVSSTRLPTTARKSASFSNKVQGKGKVGMPSTSVPAYIPFALTNGSLPCVMVDTEPRVIRRCLDGKHGSTLLAQGVSKESCIWDKAGRGNNWAYGYHGSGAGGNGCGGAGMLERVREAVRRVVERCDRFSGFVMFHSIAGGTGSGLGSALLECLRADYPLPYLITATVTPFGSGETPLQHLNSLLCLSWLQSFSDAVLLFGNDTVLEQTQKLEGGRPAGREIDKGTCVQDMNRHISSVLCSVLMPIWKPKQKSPDLSFQEGWEMIRSLCPDPATKFLTSMHTTSTRPSHTWHQTMSHLLQHSSSNLWRKGPHKAATEKARTFSLACILRGSSSGLEPFVSELGPLEAKLKKVYNTISWNPFPVDYWVSYEPSIGQTKLATVLANSSVVLDYLETVHGRARAMFDEGAYLHWYERFGCERDTFKQAFECVQGILDNYRNI